MKSSASKFSKLEDQISEKEKKILLLNKERTLLSNEQTLLANEQTLLSFVRTTLALVVAGVTIIQFAKPSFWISIVAWSFILFGVVLMIIGMQVYFKTKRTVCIDEHAVEEAMSLLKSGSL